MQDKFFPNASHTTLIGILLILSYFFLMFGNSLVSLTHPDEVFYILSAKEMVQYGRWFTPMIFDEVQFEKPFVSFALFAAAIKWFGLSPFVARFWPAFFGILGVGMTYWIAWLLFQRKRLAFFSGLILTTSFIYIALSRAVLTDMIFSVIVAISIGFFALAYFRPQYKNAGIIWCGIFSAIAVLTKGILGFTFPVAIVLIFLVYQRDLAFLKAKATLWAILLFLAIALPWHIVMYAQHGQWFWDEYFGNVHIRRLFDAEHQRLNKWYFYPGLMFAGIMPWSLFWVPAIGLVVQNFRKGEKTVKDRLFFLLAWTIGIFIFVQPATSKLASYIFPLFPAIAILIAFTIDVMMQRVRDGKSTKLFQGCVFVMTVVLIGIIVGGIMAGHMYKEILGSLVPVYIGAGVLAVATVLIFIFNLKRNFLRLIFSYMGVSVTLLAMLFLAKPYVEPWVSCKDIVEAFQKIDQSDTPILASKFYVRGIRYYTDRPMAVIDINGKGFWSPHPIPFLNTDQSVRDFLNERSVTYAIVKEGNIEDLRRIASEPRFQIEEFDGIGGKYILRITRVDG